MEKKTLRAVTAAFLMAAMPAFAGSYAVTADQAMAMVGAWSAENKGGFGLDGASVVAASPFTDAAGALLGYAVTLSDGRCVFTSADTRIEPVVAVVSDCDGRLPESHPLRTLLEGDLSNRLAAVSRASGGASLQSVSPLATKLSASIGAARAKWSRYSGGASLQAVDPSVATPNGNPPLTFAYLPGFSNANGSHLYLTHWNQSYEKTSYDWEKGCWPLTSVQNPLYNYYTPHHYVCGCVATATSTVLQYYNVTNGPVAVTNTCSVNGEKVELATVGGVYDWSILPENMGGRAPNVDNLSEAQRELLGRVAYDTGVLLGMGYDNNGTGSGAGGLAPAGVLKEHFGFATAVGYGEGGFEKTIYHHLRCDSPAILSITKEGAMSGHEVLAVGYGRDVAGTDYARVFMGWGGSSDAWYQLPKITENYNIINGVVAMLSLDGACVPFVGQVKTENGLGATGVEVSIPGVTNVLTGANGLFAFRLTEEAAKAVTEVTITAGGFTTNVAVAVGEDLEDSESLPDAIDVVLPAEASCVPSCLSPVDAVSRASHSAPQRLICLLSGRDGDPGTEAVKAYLAANADDFNGKFVLYYADVDTDGYYLQDGMPSIGVFNPAVFDYRGGWDAGNGRMGYYNATGTNVVDEAALEAMLGGTAEKWAKVLDGISLEVSGGCWVESKPAGGLTLGAPGKKWQKVEDGFSGDPAAGTYENGYGNGEEVVLTCAAEYTNAVAGIVYRCVGWELYDAETKEMVDSGDTNEAAFAAGLPELDFRWILEEAAYHVQVKSFYDGNAPPAELGGQVAPADVWVAAGETLEVVASPVMLGRYVWKFVCWSDNWEWNLETKDTRDDVVDGAVVTLLVNGPRELQAEFTRKETVGPEGPQTGTVKIGASPASVLGGMPATLYGGTAVAYDKTVTVPSGSICFALSATNFVYQGTNWVLKGWTNGLGLEGEEGPDARVSVTLEGGKAVAFDWEWEPVVLHTVETSYEIKWTNGLDNLSAAYETNLLSSADLAAAGKTLADLEVTAPKGFKPTLSEVSGNVVAKLSLDETALRPNASSALTIEAQGDGTVVVRGLVDNGVKGFWYALYSADTLTGPWQLVASGEYAEGRPVEQAQQDAPVEVAITVEPAATRQFYKLRVSDVNPAGLD